MKKLFACLMVLVFLGAVSGAAYAGKNADKALTPIDTGFKTAQIAEIEKEILKKDLPSEVYKVPERAHFLLGLNQYPDAPYERVLELQKLYQMKGSLYGHNGGLYIDKAVEKLGLHKNLNYLQLTSEIEVAGKAVFVIYPYHLLSDPINKEFIYMSPLGPKNLAEFSPLYKKYEVQWGIGKISGQRWLEIRRALGWAQFEAVKLNLYDYIKKALEWDVKKYSGFAKRVHAIQKELLADPDYLEKYNLPVPGLEGFQVQDVLNGIHVEAKDFTPDILVFGPCGWGAWGMANWKTIGSERIVFYDILGAAYDFIRNEPLILSHEFTHTNPYLQSMPTDLYFHLEMWTALTNDLADDIFFFNHPYLYIVADDAYTFFGYNSEEAKKRIWPSRFVSLRDFNRKEFEANIKRVHMIQAALNKFILEVFLPNFYADVVLWNSVNMKWCDTAAAWRIMLAFYFEPAVIFDPKKIDPETGKPIQASVQTKQWLAGEIAAGRIQELAKEAMEKTGELTELGQKMSRIEDYEGLVKCPADSSWYSLPPDIQKAIKIVLEQALREGDQRILRAFGHLMRIKMR